jgi:lipopolysaccharide/colanic/teichoic acid biosynthesis glycosyltransferase
MQVNGDELLRKFLAQDEALSQEWLHHHKLRRDPRITRVGRFLRKTSLDELPQLWNVLRGEMSLVGPRPIVEEEVAMYGQHFSLYCRVTPGITGLWQVSGRNTVGSLDRVRLDSYYVRNWSPWLDLHILARTAKVVLTGQGAY